MRRKKIIPIILIIIAIIFIVIGVAFIYIVPNFKKNNDNIKETNDKLTGKECLEGLCIDNLTITKENEICYFNGNLENTTEEKILDKYINIIFTVDGKEQKSWYHIDFMLPGDIILLNIGLPGLKSFESSKYRIEKPTDEEIKEYKKIVEEQQVASGF